MRNSQNGTKGCQGLRKQLLVLSPVCPQSGTDRRLQARPYKDPLKVWVEVGPRAVHASWHQLGLQLLQASSNLQGPVRTTSPHSSDITLEPTVYILKGKARPFCSSSLMVSSPHRLVSSMKGGEQILSSRAEEVGSAHWPEPLSLYTYPHSPVCMCVYNKPSTVVHIFHDRFRQYEIPAVLVASLAFNG